MKEIQILLLVLTLTLGLLFLLINRNSENRIYYLITKLSIMVCVVSLIMVNIMIGYAIEGQEKVIQSLQYIPNLLNEQINAVAEISKMLQKPAELQDIYNPSMKKLLINYCYQKATLGNILTIGTMTYKGIPLVGGAVISITKTTAGIWVVSQVSTIIGMYPIIVPLAISTGWLGVGFGIMYIIYS